MTKPTKKAKQKRIRWKPIGQVYKLTYPTGKIYIGSDTNGSPRYMGSPDPDLLYEDFAKLPEEVRRDYVVRKEILWESEDATRSELVKKEYEFIREYRSNDPAVGYNRRPKFKPTDNRD